MFEINYFTKDNNCPIYNFFKSIPKKDLAKILREIDLLSEFGYTLGMPHIQKIKGTMDIWELRIKIASNTYRVFYFSISNNTYILLHAFLKKSNKTPQRELDIAIRNRNIYLERND